MIVGVCGFSWSGSGAVLDYLMEFRENQVYTPEFIIAYHPDGLHDLDIDLNQSCAKFLSSGVAIPRYRYIAKSLLSGLTHGASGALTEKYLNELTQAKWIGLEQGQELLRNRWLYRKFGRRIRNHIIAKLPVEFCWKYKPYPLNQMEFSICPDDFDNKTRSYMGEILKAIGLDLKRNIVLNQPFPGNNPVPYMKYFSNAKAIVVDRDPRDVFISLKYIFPGNSYSIPLHDVHEFCSYFLNMHKDLLLTLNDPNVLFVRFEDLIYQYEKTTNQIRDFLGLEKRDSGMKTYFVPEESIGNTQVFRRFGKKEEISVIEDKLCAYLYPFPPVEPDRDRCHPFDDNPKSINYSFEKK